MPFSVACLNNILTSLLLYNIVFFFGDSYFWLNRRYTLRNAEYRLCLERNLNVDEGNIENQAPENSKLNLQGTEVDNAKANQYCGKNVKFEKRHADLSDNISVEGLGEMSSEAKKYILDLQSRLSSVKKVCSRNLHQLMK